MIHRILASSRQLILLAVICSFIASVTVLLYGVIQTGNAILQVLHEAGVSSKGGKKLVVSLVEVIDLFLLSTVFYITALGLYELFIDDNINVPEWLEIHNIDDLKGKLISVIIVVLSVLFLGQAVTWSGDANFLTFGGSVALVIASLTYFLSAHKNYKK
ncbi:YqhA family protein [Tolypothrix sp. VBCCA 56010]|uniref:YqhA family protein n=1 Tax=Tolypothrix sp. VBCCA 56010 TaxID=3137731 RepID=UPI003D7C4C1A